MQDLMEKYTNDSANKDIDSVYQKTVFSQSCNHRKTMSTHTQVRFKRVRPKQLSYFKNPFDEFKEQFQPSTTAYTKVTESFNNILPEYQNILNVYGGNNLKNKYRTKNT